MRALVLISLLLAAGAAYAGTTLSSLYPSIPPNVPVASLPTCNVSTSGVVYRVTDALLPALGIAVANGGAVAVLVRCNATSWLVGQ